MTGRTHDLAALTIVHLAFLMTLPTMSLATLITSFGAAMIGGLFPDIDQPTGKLWQDIPLGGGLMGRMVHPLLGSHRHFSHSIVGLIGVGALLKLLLAYMHTFLLTDMNIVWWAFMLGMLSHLVMDSLTKEGVPWFFPIDLNIGFPPFKFLRPATGGLVEKALVFPGLLLINGYLVYLHYGELINYFKTSLKF